MPSKGSRAADDYCSLLRVAAKCGHVCCARVHFSHHQVSMSAPLLVCARTHRQHAATMCVQQRTSSIASFISIMSCICIYVYVCVCMYVCVYISLSLYIYNIYILKLCVMMSANIDNVVIEHIACTVLYHCTTSITLD